MIKSSSSCFSLYSVLIKLHSLSKDNTFPNYNLEGTALESPLSYFLPNAVHIHSLRYFEFLTQQYFTCFSRFWVRYGNDILTIFYTTKDIQSFVSRYIEHEQEFITKLPSLDLLVIIIAHT